MFDLRPDDEQQLIIDTVRQFASEQLRPRAREVDESGKLPPDLLDQAHELGLVANALPAALGGGGERSALTSVLVAEELAWGDLALAIAILSPSLTALPLLDSGTDAQRGAHLPALVGTSFTPGALALLEPRFDADPLRPRTRALRDGDGWVLEGRKCLVPWIEGLQLVLVSADVDGRAELLALQPGAPGLGVEPARYMGLRGLPLVELSLDGVRVAADARLGGDAGCELADVVARGQVGAAALACGAARAAFELSRDYARERETFGAPIATRQSIAFMIADMATEIDGLRLLVWEAAWRLDRGLDARRQAALAFSQARRVGLQVADGAVQVYGGHGYVREYLPELLLRNLSGLGSFGAMTLL